MKARTLWLYLVIAVLVFAGMFFLGAALNS